MNASPSGRLLTFGETMGLVTADEIGTLSHVRTFRFGIGGAESNVAIGASRLGVSATWVGRVGCDAAGDLVVERLGASGVDVRAIRDPSSYTGLMVRHDRAAGVTHVDYHRLMSAGSQLRTNDLPEDLIRSAEILHLTGITPALGASARQTVFHAARIAREAGVIVSVDVNYRARLWDPGEARPVLRELVSMASIVFAGVEEATLVTDGNTNDPRSLMDALHGCGVEDVVIKDGAHGCLALIDGTVYAEPGFVVPVVIDPVGAGDAFVAGYLSDHLAGAAPAERLRTAAAMGAYATKVPGDCELLPTRFELKSLELSDEVVR